MGNTDVWSGAGWLVLSAGIVFAGHGLGLGSLQEPGSGALLFSLGLLMCGFSAAIVFRALFARRAPSTSPFADQRWSKPLIVVVTLAIYGLLFNRIGFVAATLPLLLVLMRAVDPLRWRYAIPIALAATLGVWWVLTRVLLIQLPSFDMG